MKEFYNTKSEEIPSIIDDITSGNCEIKFVSKKTEDDLIHNGYRSEVIELNLFYPSPLGENNKLKGSIYIYYPEKHNELYTKEPSMRIEIKWHKGTLVLGDGKSEEYFSSELGEIAKHVLKKESNPDDIKDD